MQDNKTNETYVEFLLEKHQIYELQNLISDEKLDFLIENYLVICHYHLSNRTLLKSLYLILNSVVILKQNNK